MSAQKVARSDPVKEAPRVADRSRDACRGQGLPVALASTAGACERCASVAHPALQPKLKLGSVTDPAEREADRVADAVTRGDRRVGPIAAPPPRPHCACGTCDACRSPSRKAVAGRDVAENVPDQVGEALRMPGMPLPDAMRRFFEPRFGRELAAVRIHQDPVAARSAEAIGARAYALGNHIVFGPGAYRPDSQEGRALIAHELTHTVQQAQPADATVRRSPDPAASAGWDRFSRLSGPTEPVALPSFGAQRSPFFTGHAQTSDEADPLVFNDHHRRPVTEAGLVAWAADAMRHSALPTHRQILSLLQRRRDDDLRIIWAEQFEHRLREVASSHGFEGSATARRRFQERLRQHADELVAEAMRSSEDALIGTVLGALHSGKIMAGAELEIDADRIARIEDAPEHDPTPLGYGLGPKPRTIRAGDEWPGKTVVSSNAYGLEFEVAGFEGIYFSIGTTELVRSNAFVGIVAGGVAQRVRALDILGKFIKGFASALASLPLALLDAGAKLIDMQTMLVAVIGRATGWYETGYTCLSSTCKTYDACTEEKSAEVCKSEVLTQALKDATIVIPIAEQIKQCYHGDAEACGGVATLFLPLIGKGVEGLTPRLEEAGVRSVFGRSRPEDPHLFDEKAQEAREKSGARSGGAGEAAPGARRGRISAFAERVRARLRGGSASVTPEVIEREVIQVERNAADPRRVGRPVDPAFDAEVATGDNRITYRREKGSQVWDRCWNPCERDAPLESATGETVDAALEKADAAAATEAVREVRKAGAPVADAVPARTLRAELRAQLEARVTEAKAAVDNLARTKAKVENRLIDIDKGLRGTTDPAVRAKLLAQRRALIDFRAEHIGSGADLSANWLEAKRLLKGTEQDYFRSLSDAARARAGYKAVTARGIDEVFGTNGRALEVEHVYPRSAIFRTPGFERLSWDDQVTLFNYEPNLKLIPADINLERSNIPYAEWSRSKWSRFPEITETAIGDMARLEQTMKAKIGQMVANPNLIKALR